MTTLITAAKETSFTSVFRSSIQTGFTPYSYASNKYVSSAVNTDGFQTTHLKFS